jgi:metal-sulfur cluster biosynthetic enzyme
MTTNNATSAAWEALAQVFDPETDLSVIDMGLVYGVKETADPGSRITADSDSVVR